MDGGAKYCKPIHSEEERRKQMPWTVVVVMAMILDEDGEGSGGEGVVPSCPAFVSLVPWPRASLSHVGITHMCLCCATAVVAATA